MEVVTKNLALTSLCTRLLRLERGSTVIGQDTRDFASETRLETEDDQN